MPRYKICVKVIIGELKGQGVKIASKCLWDPIFDNFANYQYSHVFYIYFINFHYFIN
jgi:hypothetical protein